jgi:hypothetical protein
LPHWPWTEIFLTPPPKYLDYMCAPPHLACLVFVIRGCMCVLSFSKDSWLVFLRDRVSLFVWAGLKLTSTSQVTRIIGVYHTQPQQLPENLVFGGTGVCTRVLAFTKQALWHLHHTSNPFCFSLFFRYSLMFLPGVSLDYGPSSIASQLSGSWPTQFIC